jgi:hypothetical protein
VHCHTKQLMLPTVRLFWLQRLAVALAHDTSPVCPCCATVPRASCERGSQPCREQAAMPDTECLPGMTATHLSEGCLKVYARVLAADGSLATTVASYFGEIQSECRNITARVRCRVEAACMRAAVTASQ